MPRNRRRSTRTSRRSFLGTLGLAAAGLGIASRSSAAADDQFVLEQGDQCTPLTPLSGAKPVEELYQWGVDDYDYSATGLTSLERPDTSILFLYDGPNGLSLVVVHDEYQDGTNGGSVSFDFTGLPLDGQWVVQDDFYDGDSNYDRWARNGDSATVDWTWGEGRTDGGAFRGLAGQSDLELQITPAFNAAAALYGEYYDGELTDWQVLSGSLDSPERTSLALDEPVVIRQGTCSTDGTGGSGGDGSDGGDDGSDSGEDGDGTDDSGDSGSDEESGDDTSDDSQDSESGSDSEDEDDDDDDDEYEDEDDEDDDDHPGKGEGHEKGRGKGHEKGKGKGHDKHGDHDDDDDWEDAKEEWKEEKEEAKEEWQEAKEELKEEKEEWKEAKREGDDDWKEAKREWKKEKREAKKEWKEEKREAKKGWKKAKKRLKDEDDD